MAPPLALPFALLPGQGAFLAAALFAAAFIRGFTGFGFSAVFITLAAQVTNPVPLLPVIFVCEIAMTALQARGIRADIDWRRVIPLGSGAALATVPAIHVMARLGEDQARLAVSALVLGFGLLLLGGWKLARPLGRAGHFGPGLVAGMANSAGVGGLPTAAFLAAQPMRPAAFRATMVAFLTGLDLMALPVMAANGLVGPDTGLAAAIAFPVLGLGIWAGTRRFATVPGARFRRAVVMLLAGLALLNILRAAA